MIIIKVIHFGIFFKTKIHPFCWVKTLGNKCWDIAAKSSKKKFPKGTNSIFFRLKQISNTTNATNLCGAKQPIWQLRTGVYWSASSSKDTSEIIRQKQGTEGSCHGDSPSGSRIVVQRGEGRKNAGLKRRFEPRGFTTKKLKVCGLTSCS